MEDKKSKDEVDYGPAKPSSKERCGLCRHFLPVHRQCRLVTGAITAGGWCKLFEAKSGRP